MRYITGEMGIRYINMGGMIMAFFGPRHFGVNYGFSTSPLMVASVCGPFIGGLE